MLERALMTASASSFLSHSIEAYKRRQHTVTAACIDDVMIDVVHMVVRELQLGMSEETCAYESWVES